MTRPYSGNQCIPINRNWAIPQGGIIMKKYVPPLLLFLFLLTGCGGSDI